MAQNTYQLSLTFEQIITLVRQLPKSEQIRLTKEINQQNTLEQPIRHRTQAFRHLMEQVEPVPADFDPQQAKEDSLREKYHL